MDMTRQGLVVALRRVGLIASVEEGWFDKLVDGGGENPNPTIGSFGWFNYANSIPNQEIPGGVWTTLQNDMKGTVTSTKFPPKGVTRMLDTQTGRILFDELSVGDELYLRHTINIIPKTNSTSYNLSHQIGSGAQMRRLPLGERTNLNEGGGVATGQVVIDTHMYISDENARLAGMLPQIYVSNPSIIEYSGCYISVTRR